MLATRLSPEERDTGVKALRQLAGAARKAAQTRSDCASSAARVGLGNEADEYTTTAIQLTARAEALERVAAWFEA